MPAEAQQEHILAEGCWPCRKLECSSWSWICGTTWAACSWRGWRWPASSCQVQQAVELPNTTVFRQRAMRGPAFDKGEPCAVQLQARRLWPVLCSRSTTSLSCQLTVALNELLVQPLQLCTTPCSHQAEATSQLAADPLAAGQLAATAGSPKAASPPLQDRPRSQPERPCCRNPPWPCAGGSTVTVVEGQGRKAPEPVVTRSPASFDTPLTVLINGRSASASEVLAGALKDNCRAVLVGDRQALTPKPQTLGPRS